jgi:hypothetical protein
MVVTYQFILIKQKDPLTGVVLLLIFLIVMVKRTDITVEII